MLVRNVPIAVPDVEALWTAYRRVLAYRAPRAVYAALGLGAAYYVSCLVGFALRYPSSGISFLWPPNAVLLAGLLIGATRQWPALLAAVFAAHGLAHAQDGIPAAAWVVQYFGNASQALLAAWIVRRFDATTFQDLRRLLLFMGGACIVAPALASIAPAYIYVNLGWAKDMFAGWRARTVSNAVATLSLVPSLLAVWRWSVHRPAIRWPRVLEFCALLVGLAATHVVVGRNVFGLFVALTATTPFLIWATVRFGSDGLSLALSTTVLMMSLSAPHTAGFAGADAIVAVQLLVMATAVPMFLVAGLFRQQQAEHQALLEAQGQNEAATRALVAANDRLARAGRTAAMSELTASLTHELSQPLTAVTTNVLTCLREVDPQKQQGLVNALTDVLQDMQRASAIIDRTQRLFRNRPSQPKPLNLNDVVGEVLRTAMPRLRQRPIEVQQTLAPAIPNVWGDDVQIQQVLYNLLLNAADAVSGVDVDRRVIRIATRHTRRHVILSVRDSGVGLGDVDRGRIFEPFYTTKATGTGMGLAISRSIMRNHGGALWGVSNGNGGSTFRIKMPVCPAVGVPGVSHTKRVLLVDDHPGLRKSLVRLLRTYRFDVVATSNGKRAVALATIFRPDAVVIDLSLGDGMTGLGVAKRLREMREIGSLFLVALTAHDDEDSRQACLAAGFDRYLIKQTEIAELPTVLGPPQVESPDRATV